MYPCHVTAHASQTTDLRREAEGSPSLFTPSRYDFVLMTNLRDRVVSELVVCSSLLYYVLIYLSFLSSEFVCTLRSIKLN